MSDPEVVITGYARTPFGRFGGRLADRSAAEIGAATIDELLDRIGLAPDAVDAIYAGVGMIGAATLTPARQALMLSRLAIDTPSLAVDRACCSGMTAIGIGWKDALLGLANSLICGGFEALSNTPRLVPRRSQARPGSVNVDDPLLFRAPVVDRQIAVFTGEESLRHGISRELQDEWALQSHARYHAANDRGFFDAERFSMNLMSPRGEQSAFSEDESPRRDSTLAKLASLKPVYGGATVTAGNAPGLNDGGAFLSVMRREAAEAAGLRPLATILGYAQVARGPTSGTSTPAIAIAEVLRQTSKRLGSVDLIEINEAYAATPLVSGRILAKGEPDAEKKLRQRININGGAVAIGHPLGASGARLAMTLVSALRERGGGLGVAAICGGFGQGDALLLEVVE